MQYINKLRATYLLIRGSLFPARKGNFRSPPREYGMRTAIPPEQFSSALAEISSLLRPDGTLELHFNDALSPAAPFLLYRLKSSGFSGCRAVVTPQGILLTAIR